LSLGRRTTIFRTIEQPGKATMMEEALKTHKETAFGWVLALQELWTALRAPNTAGKRPRYLTPR
jgi:hypothetical protein